MLRNRLFAIGVLLFACTAAIYVYSDGMIVPLCFIVLTVSCCFLCTIRFLTVRTAVIYSLIPIIALCWIQMYRVLIVPSENFIGEAYVTVSEKNTFTDSKSYNAKVAVNGDALIGTGVKFYTYGNVDYELGDVLLLNGSFEASVNDSKLLADRIFYTFKGDICQKGKSNGVFTNIRRKINELCDIFLPAEISGFAKAITSADCSGITSNEYFLHSKAGTSHILSVSGLHISIIILSVYYLLRRLIHNKTVVLYSVVTLILLYCGITGFSYPCVRSGIMLAIMLFCSSMSTRCDRLTSLFLALAIILLINPFAIASLSLQLSFLSTVGILITVDTLKNARFYAFTAGIKFFDIFISPAIMTVAAFLFTLPITASSFGIVSYVAPITSGVTGILFTPILILSYLMCMFGAIWTPMGFIAAFPLKYLIELFYCVIRFLSSFDFSASTVNTSMTVCFLIIAVGSITFLFISKPKLRLTALLVSLSMLSVFLCICCFASVLSYKPDRIALYESGDGFAIYFYSEGNGLLIENDCAYGYRDVLIESDGLSCKNMLIMKYGEYDDEITRFMIDCMRTEKIYIPYPNERDIYVNNSIMSLANKNSCDIITYTSQAFDIGAFRVMVTDKAIEVAYYGKGICIPLNGNIDTSGGYDFVLMFSDCLPNQAYTQTNDNTFYIRSSGLTETNCDDLVFASYSVVDITDIIKGE